MLKLHRPKSTLGKMKQPQLTPEQLLENTEKEFHESNKLWSEASVTYANAGLKLFDDMIKFVYQALTSMGLVSGFGFAGIQGVKNLYLFALGEIVIHGSEIHVGCGLLLTHRDLQFLIKLCQ